MMRPALRRSDRLKVTNFTTWSERIRIAVEQQPEPMTCPTDVYLSVLRRTLSHGGRVAVVERAMEPIAVIGLRRDGRFRWRNAADWLMPGFVCAASNGEILPAFAALRTEVALAWWRMPGRPAHPAIRELYETPVHRIGIDEREDYWRSTGYLRSIRAARKKCAALQVSVNGPGDAEWVIRSAGQKWSDGDVLAADASVDDKVDLADRLERSGRFFTLVLRDGDRRLAGTTNIVDGDVGVAGTLYRDDSVGSLPTGVRIIDEVLAHCARRGIVEFDFGGGYSYKARWGRPEGSRYELIMSPHLRYRARRSITELARRGRKPESPPARPSVVHVPAGAQA